MKKGITIIAAALICVCLLVGVAGYFVYNHFFVNTAGFETAQAVFVYNEKNIDKTMSENDMDTLKNMFNGKSTIGGEPRCGFNDSIAVVFNGDKFFLIANDDCGSVYYKNEDIYFTLNDKENAQMREILKRYGFEWPCL